MKAVLKHLPLKAVYFLAFFPTAVIYALIHGLYVPLSRLFPGAAGKLPLFDHMMFWTPNPFKFIRSACFDLMHAPISYHFREDEMTALAESNGVTIEKLVLTHGTTWSLVGRKA